MKADVETKREAYELKARWEREHGCVASIMAYERLQPTKRGLNPVIDGYRVSCQC